MTDNSRVRRSAPIAYETSRLAAEETSMKPFNPGAYVHVDDIIFKPVPNDVAAQSGENGSPPA